MVLVLSDGGGCPVTFLEPDTGGYLFSISMQQFMLLVPLQNQQNRSMVTFGFSIPFLILNLR